MRRRRDMLTAFRGAALRPYGGLQPFSGEQDHDRAAGRECAGNPGIFRETAEAGDAGRNRRGSRLAAIEHLQTGGDAGVEGLSLRAAGTGRLLSERSEEHTSELQSLMRISY